jgi:hypothetical protein
VVPTALLRSGLRMSEVTPGLLGDTLPPTWKVAARYLPWRNQLQWICVLQPGEGDIRERIFWWHIFIFVVRLGLAFALGTVAAALGRAADPSVARGPEMEAADAIDWLVKVVG